MLQYRESNMCTVLTRAVQIFKSWISVPLDGVLGLACQDTFPGIMALFDLIATSICQSHAHPLG